MPFGTVIYGSCDVVISDSGSLAREGGVDPKTWAEEGGPHRPSATLSREKRPSFASSPSAATVLPTYHAKGRKRG